MPSHVPDEEGRFLCSQRDMAMLSPKEGDQLDSKGVEIGEAARKGGFGDDLAPGGEEEKCGRRR